MKLSIKELQHYETEILKEISEICNQNKISYSLAYGSVLGAVRHQGPIPWDSDVDIVVPIHQFSQFIKTIRAGLSEEFYLDYFDTNKYYPFLFPRVGLKGYSTNVLHIDIFKLVGIPSGAEDQKKFMRKALPYNNLFKYKNISQKYGAKFSLKGKLFYAFIKILLSPISNTYIINKFEKLCSKYPYEKSVFVMNINGGYGKREIIPKVFYGEGKTFTYSNLEIKVPEQHHEYLNHFYGDYMEFPSEDERKVPSFFEITKC